MTDIAKLAFAVDTRAVKIATTDLDKLGRSAETAGSKTDKARKVIAGGLIAVAGAATAAAGAVAAIYAKQSQLIDAQAKLAQRMNTTYTSMANLSRAGDLAGVSMGEISTASRTLEINLARAEQGSKAQADALGRLELTSRQLAAVPLDQRITMINKALRENVPQTERAAVAAELFGSRGAAAMQALNPETIADAAHQVEVFGLNLSDVDAAKVEMANDAFSTFGMLADGIGKQLTVELAPIVKAVADLFFSAAEEAGGMGNVVRDAVDRSVRAIAFAADAVDGLGRVFTLVTSGAAVGIAQVVKGIVNVQRAILELAAKVPGMKGIVAGPLDAMETMSSMAQAVIDANMAKIDKALNEPLAGRKLVQFVEQARESGQASAEAAVAAREMSGGLTEVARAAERTSTATSSTTDAVQQQISAMERAAATWGMTADQVQVYDLRMKGATDTQIAYARSLLDTVAALDAQREAQEEAKRAQEQIDRDAAGIIESLMSEEARLAESYQRRRQIVEQATFETEEARQAILAQLEQQYNEQQLERERARITAILDMNQQMFSGLSGLAKAYAGEQSTLYRVMFAVEQGFAVAKALMNAPTAFSEAYTATVGIPVIGPVLAPIAGATAAAAQVAQAGAIRSIAPSFDGGGFTGYGPRTGGLDGKGGFMAMLHPRETVVDHTKGQSMGGNQQQVTNNFIMQGRPDNRTQAQISQTAARSQRRANARFGQ